MTPRLMIRPVLVSLAAAVALTACSAAESEPDRFEAMAESVAAIPLDDAGRRDAAGRRSGDAVPRPDVRVEVMDPHALWDARDADMGAAVERAAPRIAAAAAPAVAEAVVERVSTRIDAAAARVGLQPANDSEPVVAAPRPPSAAAPTASGGLVQLGAWSSEAAARAAWDRLSRGEAAWALDGLTPVYEQVEVNGRSLTRLKVRAPASGAPAICAAAGIDDPWCRRGV